MPSDNFKYLYRKDGHECIVFSDLVTGEGVQANQFLLIDNGAAALIDPGGDLTYTPLSIELSKHVDIKDLQYIFASHQDPDIIASLPRWLMHSDCKVLTSKLWSRFLPHLASSFVTHKMTEAFQERIISVPDKGGKVRLGHYDIHIIPAHFLHSVGNFHFYDPVSKILFSGDMGASMGCDDDISPVENFEEHVQYMEGFHRRYMASNRACRHWADRVARMDIEIMMPQHGRAIAGKKNIAKFLKWISELRCGVDLL